MKHSYSLVMFNAIVPIILLIGTCNGENILLTLPVSTVSTNNVFCGIAKSLLNNQHHVTFLSPWPPNFTHENMTAIKLLTNKKLLANINLFKLNETAVRTHVEEVITATARALWHGLDFEDLADNISKFDVVVIPKLMNEVAFPFLADFEGALVSVFSEAAEQYILPTVLGLRKWEGKDTYIPHHQLPCHNSLYWQTVASEVLMMPETVDVLKSYRKTIPNIKFDLTLVNSVTDVLHPTPLLSNQFAIGGIGIKQRTLPLPHNIETFIRSQASKGTVYISLGTQSKSSYVPNVLKESLTEAIQSLNLSFIWQHNTVGDVIMPNVMYQKNLPQQHLLGHTSTVLFISHCSTSSVQEALYFSVPLLCVPLAMDQHANARKVSTESLGYSVNWQTLSQGELVDKIKALITDDKIAAKITSISKKFRSKRSLMDDRLVRQVEEAVKQVEEAVKQGDEAKRHTLRHSEAYINSDELCYLPDIIATRNTAWLQGFVFSSAITFAYVLLTKFLHQNKIKRD